MIYDLIVGLFFGVATVIPGLTGATLLVVFDRYFLLQTLVAFLKILKQVLKTSTKSF